MKTILLSRDLIFISRVREVAASRQHEAVIAKSLEALKEAINSLAPGQQGVLLIDLEKSPVAVEALEPILTSLSPEAWRLVSFYSHVHVDTAQDAKRRGLGEVMPRSRFIQILPGLFD